MTANEPESLEQPWCGPKRVHGSSETPEISEGLMEPKICPRCGRPDWQDCIPPASPSPKETSLDIEARLGEAFSDGYEKAKAQFEAKESRYREALEKIRELNYTHSDHKSEGVKMGCPGCIAKEALAATDEPTERDFTPEEALAEAQKRWGPGGRIGITDKLGGELLCVVGYLDRMRSVLRNKDVKGGGSTFRAAFAAADRDKENPQ